MIVALWAMSAPASAPDAYPLRAVAELPAHGIVRIRVPVELRTPEDPEDATDLLLVDASGQAVPVVRLTGPASYDERAVLAPEPLPEAGHYRLDLGPLAVDGLRVVLPVSPSASWVSVRDADGELLAPRTWIWRLANGEHALVPLPPVAGPVWVQVEGIEGRVFRAPPRFASVRRLGPDITDDVRTVVPTAWTQQENGWLAVELPLDRPQPIAAVRVHADAPIFERGASVRSVPWEARVNNPLEELYPAETTAIRKVSFGDVFVELTEVPVPQGVERPALLIDALDRPPLNVTSVDLVIHGAQLLARDVGPGPHTLYGGAPPGTSPRWDLGAAAPELLRRAPAAIEVGPVQPNPTWIAPEVQANLVAPSTELDVDGFAWVRDVHGSPGPVRIPIPGDVLAAARSGLADVRLATEGRKVPHVVRRGIGDPVLQGVTVERTEEGRRSRLRITLPIDGVPVSAVVLSTSASVFDRVVQVEVPRGANLQLVRASRWLAQDRPGSLALGIDSAIGDSLLVTIDNGDDPPLPIDEVRIHVPAWELVAVLPEGPVQLYYGDPRRNAPDYDLALLTETLRRRALQVATLGPAQAVERPALSWLDRLFLAVGVGVLALGLVAMIVDLVRRTGSPDAPPPVPEPGMSV